MKNPGDYSPGNSFIPCTIISKKRNKKSLRHNLRLYIFGWKTGFEPATSGTTIQRSNQLNYIHHLFCGCKYIQFIFFTI